jgi:hypothetical protein
MIRVGLIAALAALAAALPAQGARAAACNGKGIAAQGYRIVKLEASGVSCTKARSVAGTVARQLHASGGIHLPDVAGFALSTETCIGCGGTTTRIALTYANGGKVTLSLRGGGSGNVSPAPAPAPGSGKYA